MKENNLDVTIPVVPIPKMKIPGTAEQLQQQYNSEEWEELKESLCRVGTAIKEWITPIIAELAKVMKDIYKAIMKAYSVDPEIKKCYRIYRRTKNRRIRKKQMTRIRKIIERRYIKK